MLGLEFRFGCRFELEFRFPVRTQACLCGSRQVGRRQVGRHKHRGQQIYLQLGLRVRKLRQSRKAGFGAIQGSDCVHNDVGMYVGWSLRLP